VKWPAIIALGLSLAGCGIHSANRPSFEKLAKFCGVDPAELRSVQVEMKAALAPSIRTIGSCRLVKTDDGRISLLAIRYPPGANAQ
jgi:hypothetical protein